MIYNANNVEDKFKLDVKITVKSETLKNFNINTNIYLPLSYGSRGGSGTISSDRTFIVEGYNWFDCVYSTIWIIVSLLGSIILIRWKGINM